MAQSLTSRPEDGQPLDRVFDALCHPYRRRLLLHLWEDDPGDTGVDVDRIATEDDDLERVTTELHHAHLPKLAEAGYVEWTRGSRTVRRGPAFEEVASILRTIHDRRSELPGEWP